MRHGFLRISCLRRSAVYLAWGLVCCCNAYSLLRLLSEDDAVAMRCIQLLIIFSQGCLAFSLALAQHESPAVESNEQLKFGCIGNLAPYGGGRGYLASELARLLLHATLSWYPLEPLDAGTCHIPRINVLMQQAVTAAGTALLGIPAKESMQSLLLLPLYCFLDWRYASLNAIPGNATLLGYLGRRGALLLLSRLFFSGIPALIMMRSNTAQQVAVYVFCLPLLAVQCFASGVRLFHGIDSVGLWEVWMATVVAFGIGTDVGHVLEELRAQFSKVRMIADDILPHHVVDTLMQQQQQSEEEEDAEQEQQQARLEAQPSGSGGLEALLSTPGPKPLVRTASASSASSASLAAALPQLRPSASMSHPTAAALEARQQLPPCRSQPAAGSPAAAAAAAGSGSGRKPRSRSAELPQMGVKQRSSSRRTSALVASDEAEYAEEHPGACILFADVCGFTTISEGTSPAIIVNMLNKLFSKFDESISESPFLYKLDVIGDCFMVASGLHWHAGDPCPARTLIDFAKLMLKTAATVLDPVMQRPLSMRCGIHSGPVVGALLGSVRRKYSLFGDPVNAASRLESTSLPGAIHVSAAVYQQLWRPCLRVEDRQPPLERLPHELRCVEEDGEQEPPPAPGPEAEGEGGDQAGGPMRAASSASAGALGAPASASSGSGTGSGTGTGTGSSSTWGSLHMRRAAAGEDAEGRSLEGMGLLAIGSLAREEACGHADAAAGPPVPAAAAKGGGPGRGPAEHDRLASDQDEPHAQRQTDPSSVRLHAQESMLSSMEGGGAQRRHSYPGPVCGHTSVVAAECDPMGQELWVYRGKIELKGRAALETYLLQVI